LEAEFPTGDHEVLRRAYEAHGSLVYSFCRRAVGEDRAKDVTQEVFLTAWRSRHRYEPHRGSLAGWLVGIARNKVLDALRRRQLHLIEDVEQLSGPADVAPDSVDGLADRMLLATALEALPSRVREAISLAYDEQLTHHEIAHRTGQPLGTVKSDIRRGLDRLRRHLELVDV
jgi:RNA polymerase sigma-70 factor (ECF subfamily)